MQQRLERTVLVTAAVAVAARFAAAQSMCFEPYSTSVFENAARVATAGDLDGDGDLDLVTNAEGAARIAWNDGNGVFGAPAAIASGMPGPGFVVDMDRDGRLDVAGAGAVMWNEGNGAFVTTAFQTNDWVLPNCAVGDVDGDGLLDVVGGHSFSSGSSVGYVFHNDGLRDAWSTNFDLPFELHNGSTGRTWLADVDADGDLDFVAPHAFVPYVSVSRNDGTGWFPSRILLETASSPFEAVVAQLDGDPALDVAAVDGAGNLSVFRALSPGVFAPRVDVSFGAGVPFALIALDLDGDGDLDLAAPTHVNGATAPHGRMVRFMNDGNAGFTPATAFTSVRPLVGAVAGDFDRDGDVDFATAVSMTGTTNTIAVRRGCSSAGRVYCAGDGTAGACPCSNSEPSGSQHGCFNSTGLGAGLRGAGTLHVSYDNFVLTADRMPLTTTAFFFQGTAATNGGLGAPFGDGLSCATGTIRRIATKTTVAGTARYPEPGEPRISLRGEVLAPGTRTYQVLYRNVVGFCTPATFNLTNGLDVVWR